TTDGLVLVGKEGQCKTILKIGEYCGGHLDRERDNWCGLSLPVTTAGGRRRGISRRRRPLSMAHTHRARTHDGHTQPGNQSDVHRNSPGTAVSEMGVAVMILEGSRSFS